MGEAVLVGFSIGPDPGRDTRAFDGHSILAVKFGDDKSPMLASSVG